MGKIRVLIGGLQHVQSLQSLQSCNLAILQSDAVADAIAAIAGKSAGKAQMSTPGPFFKPFCRAANLPLMDGVRAVAVLWLCCDCAVAVLCPCGGCAGAVFVLRLPRRRPAADGRGP